MWGIVFFIEVSRVTWGFNQIMLEMCQKKFFFLHIQQLIFDIEGTDQQVKPLRLTWNWGRLPGNVTGKLFFLSHSNSWVRPNASFNRRILLHLCSSDTAGKRNRHFLLLRVHSPWSTEALPSLHLLFVPSLPQPPSCPPHDPKAINSDNYILRWQPPHYPKAIHSDNYLPGWQLRPAKVPKSCLNSRELRAYSRADCSLTKNWEWLLRKKL